MSIWDSRGLLIYCCCVAAALGAVFGSFLNCAAWRIAHGRSFLRGRSICPACEHELRAEAAREAKGKSAEEFPGIEDLLGSR